MPGFGKGLPKPPKIMVGQFLFGRGGNGNHFIAAGVQRGGYPFDISSLSGGVPSLIGHDDGDSLPVQGVVQFL